MKIVSFEVPHDELVLGLAHCHKAIIYIGTRMQQKTLQVPLSLLKVFGLSFVEQNIKGTKFVTNTDSKIF